MSRTIVLGGGVSALAYLLYHPKAKAIVGDQAGGQFAQQSHLGPQLIWADERSTDLLKRLKLPLTKKRVQVGYFQQATNSVVDTPDVAFVNSYARKTRGTPAQASFLSSGRSEFEVFSTPVDELVAVLISRVSKQLEPGWVEMVDLTQRTVGVQKRAAALGYDVLVSTIAAPVFFRIAKIDTTSAGLKARTKIYDVVSISSLPKWAQETFADTDVDYIYVASPIYPYHRVRKAVDHSGGVDLIAVIETTLQEREQLPRKGPEVLTRTVQPNGQIVSGTEFVKSHERGDLVFLGRYAQWDHAVKLNQVLSKIEVLRDGKTVSQGSGTV